MFSPNTGSILVYFLTCSLFREGVKNIQGGGGGGVWLQLAKFGGVRVSHTFPMGVFDTFPDNNSTKHYVTIIEHQHNYYFDTTPHYKSPPGF